MYIVYRYIYIYVAYIFSPLAGGKRILRVYKIDGIRNKADTESSSPAIETSKPSPKRVKFSCISVQQ